MNRIFNVLKPPCMTSSNVVSDIKRITGIKKSRPCRYSGSMPREFMIVCCGKATKLSGYLMDGEKEYIGELLLGYENGYAGSCREKNMFKRRQTPL